MGVMEDVEKGEFIPTYYISLLDIFPFQELEVAPVDNEGDDAAVIDASDVY